MNLEKIVNAKHILIKTDNQSFANASAVYSFILTLHKKVSIVSQEKIESKFSFLPWFDKIRDKTPSSADLIIECTGDIESLFMFFKAQNIKVNIKMATSLYASLLVKYKNFTKDCNGMTFATASELIQLKAEHKMCDEYLNKRVALSEFRLKSILYSSLHLKNSALSAEIYLCDDDLKSSGASMQTALSILEEFLTLVHVVEVTLFKSDDNNKIIRTLKEI